MCFVIISFPALVLCFMISVLSCFCVLVVVCCSCFCHMYEGLVARSMVPVTYDSWLTVDEETKEACWQYILVSLYFDCLSLI
jgi:hypothetical protein